LTNLTDPLYSFSTGFKIKKIKYYCCYKRITGSVERTAVFNVGFSVVKRCRHERDRQTESDQKKRVCEKEGEAA